MKGTDVAVVEVKLAIRIPADGNWATTAEAAQVARYAHELGVPGLLVDANRIYLVSVDDNGIVDRCGMVIERSTATRDDLALVRMHLFGG